MERPLNKPVTLKTLRHWAQVGQKFAMLTCYDATTAKWLQRAGIPALLVGDTAAQMILGYERTIHAPLDFMIQITGAVKRGAPRCHVMGDMPFMSYQADDAEALRNAGRFMTEGGADSVKLELVASQVPLVQKMSDAGIAVVAHIGLQCQRMKTTGNYLPGETAESARELIDLAVQMEQAGAAMILIEKCPAPVSKKMVEAVSIPVIGCGGGPACHGHVVVLHDLLGLTEWHPPFIAANAQIGQNIMSAALGWARKVHEGEYLKDDHPYEMGEGEEDKL